MKPADAFPHPDIITGRPRLDGLEHTPYDGRQGYSASLVLARDVAQTAAVNWYQVGPPERAGRADLSVDIGPLTLLPAQGEDLAETLHALARHVELATRRAERGLLRDRAANAGHVVDLGTDVTTCSCGWTDDGTIDALRVEAVVAHLEISLGEDLIERVRHGDDLPPAGEVAS